jgi:hypothetical protein
MKKTGVHSGYIGTVTPFGHEIADAKFVSGQAWNIGTLLGHFDRQVKPVRMWGIRASKAFKRQSNFFSFLSLYFMRRLSERILKTALAGSKSYLFLCLFIFQRQAFAKTLENQRNNFETLFAGVPKKRDAKGRDLNASFYRELKPVRKSHQGGQTAMNPNHFQIVTPST